MMSNAPRGAGGLLAQCERNGAGARMATGLRFEGFDKRCLVRVDAVEKG
jgi:hypothetical protein